MPGPPDSDKTPPIQMPRLRNVDGVTAEERDRPPGDPALIALEKEVARRAPSQLDLFAVDDGGTYTTEIGGIGPLSAASSLTLARSAWRQHLEHARRPRNTIDSYSYDLRLFEEAVGPKRIDQIQRADIARFLGGAHSKSTRKRRLTSLRRFFRFLIDDARVLRLDPSDGYYPHQIRLRTPVALYADEQIAMLDAARADEPWSALAVWLMMRLGLTRGELLSLERDHIDRSQPDAPIVHILYAEVAKQSKERRLQADREFATLFGMFLESHDVEQLLFVVGAQAVNGMVERVRLRARITKPVTPQTLRATFAVEQARSGADQQQLLALLGLVDDLRNRQSVDRYLALAAEPLPVAHPAP